MLGFQFVVHATKILFYDIWVTARLILLPVLIGYGLVYLVGYLLTGGVFTSSLSGMVDPTTDLDGRAVLAMFLGFLIVAISFTWAAVGWHRFVLLNEMPGRFLPTFSWPLIQSYIWGGLRIFFVIVALTALFVAILQILIGIGLSFPLVLTGYSIVVYALVLRISLVLPGAAVDKSMTLKQSWQLTKGSFGPLIVVALAVMALNFLGTYFLAPGYAGLVISMILNWFGFALGISILTTLYGVYVENRTL